MPLTTREVITPSNYSNIIVHVERSGLTATFPEHWHLFAEFIYATKDGQCVNISGNHYTMKKGDLLFIWPTELHSFAGAPQSDAYQMIQFDVDIISSHHDISMYFNRMQRVHLVTAEAGLFHDSIRRKFEEIVRIHCSQEHFAETRIRILIAEILLRIAETVESEDNPNVRDTSDVSGTFLKIKDACTYITEHCGEDIAEENIALRTGFSTYYFSRMFKKYAGESFSDYLNRQRISRALKLLRFDSVPITEVAFSSGYQSISNFNKVFKKNIGISPNEYRKLHQSKPHENITPRSGR